MQKRNQKEKLIGDNELKDFILVPNKSLGKFLLGDNISNYLYLSHTMEHINERTFSYDSYDFYNGEITIWPTEEKKIETIRCDSKCYWKKQNLIGMMYEDFLVLANQYPNSENIEYVPISRDRGQNQKIYDFDNLGLRIWVWKRRIKTILISQSED